VLREFNLLRLKVAILLAKERLLLVRSLPGRGISIVGQLAEDRQELEPAGVVVAVGGQEVLVVAAA